MRPVIGRLPALAAVAMALTSGVNFAAESPEFEPRRRAPHPEPYSPPLYREAPHEPTRDELRAAEKRARRAAKRLRGAA